MRKNLSLRCPPARQASSRHSLLSAILSPSASRRPREADHAARPRAGRDSARQPERHARRGRADRAAGEGREPGRFLLGQHADRPEHDRVPRHRPGRRENARREGALRQLSAQRGGPGLDRRRSDSGSRPRADQLPARQPDQELQLPGRRLATTKRRSMLSQYMRLQNFANEAVRQHRPLGRLRQAVPQADRPERDQGDADREVREGADQEDLHLQPAGVRLPRPAAEQAPRADALRAEERQGQPSGRGPAAIRQGPHLHRRRRDRKARRRSSARTGASSRRWTTR